MLTTLLPAAQGTDTGGLNFAGTVPTNVQTDDGDTSAREFQTSSTAFTVTLDDLPSAAQVVTRVDVSTKGRWNGVGVQGDYYNRIRDTTNVNNDGVAHQPNTSYVLYTSNFAQGPGSVAWTPAVVNSLQAGIIVNTGYGSGRLYVTWIYVEVTWDSGGDFALFVSGLGPLVAIGVEHLAGILRHLRHTTRTRFSREEALQLLQAIRSAPHRAYVFGGR